jgi:type II secretory pathway component PulL
MLHDIRIEIMSYISPVARLRKEEVALALESLESRLAQEDANCQVSRVHGLIDATAAELTGMLWRYIAHVNVTALHTKTRTSAPYFSKFNVEPGPAHTAPDGTVNQPEVSSNE